MGNLKNLTFANQRLKILLLLIFLIGSFLRFYRLSSIPDSIDGDEAAFGYYAYSLEKEKTDEYGNKYPLYFESIGDYKYPVYAYLSILPVKLFGLNEFSSRFLSAFSGSLTIVLLFLITSLIYESKNITILSSFLLAISPWHIIFSRGAFESNLGLFLPF